MGKSILLSWNDIWLFFCCVSSTLSNSVHMQNVWIQIHKPNILKYQTSGSGYISDPRSEHLQTCPLGDSVFLLTPIRGEKLSWVRSDIVPGCHRQTPQESIDDSWALRLECSWIVLGNVKGCWAGWLGISENSLLYKSASCHCKTQTNST